METRIIQITSGRGPAECTWVVAQVLKYIIAALKDANITYTVAQREQGTENGTLQSVTLQLKGKALKSFLNQWLGTIKWEGQSPYRPSHKRKNWFVGIYELQEVQYTHVQETDIKFQAIRSSGPGGQHVNKVSSAVRATHTPTGVQVVVMDCRSQHQNKKVAIKRLHAKLEAYNAQQLKTTAQHQWQNHLQLERGNPVQIFKGKAFKQKRQSKTFKALRQQIKQTLKQHLWD